MVDPASLIAGLGSLASGISSAAGGLGTLGTLAGAGAGAYGALESAAAAKKASGTTVNLPAAAPAVQSPVGSQTSSAAGPGPSFLAAAAAPQSTQRSGASLLGQ